MFQKFAQPVFTCGLTQQWNFSTPDIITEIPGLSMNLPKGRYLVTITGTLAESNETSNLVTIYGAVLTGIASSFGARGTSFDTVGQTISSTSFDISPVPIVGTQGSTYFQVTLEMWGDEEIIPTFYGSVETSGQISVINFACVAIYVGPPLTV